MTAFEREFTSYLLLCAEEAEMVEAAAKLLGKESMEVFAGNRHNTEELDQAYEDLSGQTPKASIDTGDHFGTILYLHVYRGEEVVLSSDYVGFFCTEPVGRVLLGG